MKLFERTWLIRQAKLILILLILGLVITLYYYLTGDANTKSSALLGGLATGLLLVIIQYMFSWHEHVERDRFRLLGLKRVLDNKVDRAYYGKLIKSSKRRIDLMGKTAHRFLEDFANKGGSDNEATLFLEALARGVEVRFLLPESINGEPNNAAKDYIQQLSELHANFTCKYFKPPECHSILLFDDDIMIGPYFPATKSRNTPALHLQSESILSKCYIDYFNTVWNDTLESTNKS